MFAKEIDVPDGIKAYRVSGFYPSILKLKISPGYFMEQKIILYLRGILRY